LRWAEAAALTAPLALRACDPEDPFTATRLGFAGGSGVLAAAATTSGTLAVTRLTKRI
jgi:hypothetical protein